MHSKSSDIYRLQTALSIRKTHPAPLHPDSLSHFLIGDLKNTIHIIKDKAGQSIGYVLYALISKDSLEMISSELEPPKYSYEWEEGRIVMVVDTCFIAHRSIEAASQLRTFLKSFRLVCYIRNNYFKVLVKKFGIHRRAERIGKKWRIVTTLQKYR